MTPKNPERIHDPVYQVHGASRLRVFLRVVLPLALPGVVGTTLVVCSGGRSSCRTATGGGAPGGRLPRHGPRHQPPVPRPAGPARPGRLAGHGRVRLPAGSLARHRGCVAERRAAGGLRELPARAPSPLGWYRERGRATVTERARLRAALAGLGIRSAPSDGNFLFADVRRDADQVCAVLRQRGVLVCSGRAHGAPTWIGVTVGQSRDNQRFAAALRWACPRFPMSRRSIRRERQTARQERSAPGRALPRAAIVRAGTTSPGRRGALRHPGPGRAGSLPGA